MKARLAFMSALFILFGLTIQARADDGRRSNRPDQYQPINPKKLKDQMKKLEQGNPTSRDIQAFSAEIHNVSVIDVPSSQTDGSRGRAYLQGQHFKLNAIYSGN